MHPFSCKFEAVLNTEVVTLSATLSNSSLLLLLIVVVGGRGKEHCRVPALVAFFMHFTSNQDLVKKEVRDMF